MPRGAFRVPSRRANSPPLSPGLLDLAIASAPRLSVVVLPFSNLGGTEDEDHLVDAITDDLTTDLSRLPGALVIAHHSAATYKGKSVSIRQAGEELGVRYVVQGSVRKLDDVLRVNVRLIATETSTHLWAGRFDQIAEEGSFGQDVIVGRLRATREVCRCSTPRLRERPYRMRSISSFGRGRPGAIHPVSNHWPRPRRFEQALQLDASLVAAMCGLAYVLVDQV